MFHSLIADIPLDPFSFSYLVRTTTYRFPPDIVAYLLVNGQWVKYLKTEPFAV
jgi:hypothetical protein